MYSIYGCPMHYGVGDEGLIYSIDYLNQLHDLQIPIIPEITVMEDSLPNLKNLTSVIATCKVIAKHQNRIIQLNETPLFIAGDHSAVIGSISGTSVHYKDLGLIWIDAHPDINTDATTVTGNIHGMPVAALLGMGEKSLTNILTSEPKLKPENIVMIGVRDIDPPEQVFMDQLNIKYYTYDDVCHIGLDQCIKETLTYLSHCDGVHISFDIDSMDPAIMPGVSVPVPNGFQVPDVYHMIHAFLTQLPVAAIDIVEYNMVHDKDHVTANFLLDIIKHIKTG